MTIIRWNFKDYYLLCKVLVLCLTSIFSILLIFIPSQEWIETAFRKTGYYFVFVVFVLWIIYLYQLKSTSILIFFKNHNQALSLAMIISILVFYVSPPQFKILADETNLLGTSMSMYKEKHSDFPTKGFEYRSSKKLIDKRPLLYPFLTSIIHSLTGYRAINNFMVNFFLSICTLFLFYYIMQDIYIKRYGLISILLIAGCPIYYFWFTSGGFEPINLVFFLFVINFLYQFLKTKRSDFLSVLVFSIVLFAYCRYESIVMIVPLGLIISNTLNKNILKKCSWMVFIIPVFLIPVFWQRKLFLNKPFFVLDDINKTLLPDLYSAFEMQYFKNNIFDNIFVLAGIDPSYGFSCVIFIFAMIGLYLVARKILLKYNYIKHENKMLFIFLIFSLGIYVLINFSYFWGNFTQKVSNRLALIFLPYLIISAVYAIKCVENKIDVVKCIVPLLCIFHIIYFLPYSKDQSKISGLVRTIEYNNVIKYFKHNYSHIPKEKILVISDSPNFYIVQGYGAIDFEMANNNKSTLNKYHSRYFSRTIILQKYIYPYNSPNVDARLSPDFKFHTIGVIKQGLVNTNIGELESIE